MEYEKYEVNVYPDGKMVWRLGGLRHRVGGPAYVDSTGRKAWYLFDERSRLDGPAIERASGYNTYYIGGVKYSAEEHAKEVKRLSRPCAGKMVEIDGVKYTLVAEKEVERPSPSCAGKTVEIDGVKHTLVVAK